jgi:hypothetical protein
MTYDKLIGWSIVMLLVGMTALIVGTRTAEFSAERLNTLAEATSQIP